MTPSRSVPYSSPNRRQAARQSSGCLPGFVIPPLAALFVGLLLATLAGGLSDSGGVRAEVQAAPVAQQVAADGKIAPLFTPEVQYWAANIVRWASDLVLHILFGLCRSTWTISRIDTKRSS